MLDDMFLESCKLKRESKCDFGFEVYDESEDLDDPIFERCYKFKNEEGTSESDDDESDNASDESNDGDSDES